MAVPREKLKVVPKPSGGRFQDALPDAHHQAATVSNRELVLQLQELFGADTVAYMVGVEDQKVIGRWGRGERPIAGDRERRLRAMYLIVRLIAVAYSEDAARGWFFSPNPRLADQAPADTLGETPGRLPLVLAAAKSFVGIE